MMNIDQIKYKRLVLCDELVRNRDVILDRNGQMNGGVFVWPADPIEYFDDRQDAFITRNRTIPARLIDEVQCFEAECVMC